MLPAPDSGNGVMTPLPGPGAPPAPQAPRGTGQHQAQTTTFPCNHAKRHRQPQHPLQRTASDDAMRKSRGRNRGLSPCMHQFARPWDHAPTTRIASRAEPRPSPSSVTARDQEARPPALHDGGITQSPRPSPPSATPLNRHGRQPPHEPISTKRRAKHFLIITHRSCLPSGARLNAPTGVGAC